jgi:rhamnosyltransferase
LSASILILCKNEAANMEPCLEAVFGPKGAGPFEVMVVDSGSTDGRVEIARRYPVRIEQIPAEAFHHAHTRNFAATLAQGEFTVYLAADALPATTGWLHARLSNVSDPLRPLEAPHMDMSA